MFSLRGACLPAHFPLDELWEASSPIFEALQGTFHVYLTLHACLRFVGRRYLVGSPDPQLWTTEGSKQILMKSLTLARTDRGRAPYPDSESSRNGFALSS